MTELGLNSSPNQLLGLIIVYLAKDKAIVTKEFIKIEAGGDLPTFRCIGANIEPHGGEELMLKSLRFKETSVEQLVSDCLSDPTVRKQLPNGVLASGMASTEVPKITLNINELKCSDKMKKCLVQEIIPDEENPSWKLDEKKSQANKCYEYFINLPPNTSIKDCELDVSKVG